MLNLISHWPFKVQSKPWCQVWSESGHPVCPCVIRDQNRHHIKRSWVHQPPLWKCFFLFLTMIFLFSNSGLGNGTSGFSWKHTLQSVIHYNWSCVTISHTLQSALHYSHTLQLIIHYSQSYITATHYNRSGVTISYTLQSVIHDSQSYITVSLYMTVSHTLQMLQSVIHYGHTLQLVRCHK